MGYGVEEEIVKKYAKKVVVLEIISLVTWIFIILYQFLFGLLFLIFGYGLAMIIAGIWNIVACVKTIKNITYFNSITTMGQVQGVANFYKMNRTSTIIFMILNFIFGGVLGGFASLYDLIIGIVLENDAQRIIAENDVIVTNNNAQYADNYVNVESTQY